MIKNIIISLIAAIRHRAGSLRATRIVPAPSGPVPVYAIAESSPDCIVEGCDFIHGNTTLPRTQAPHCPYISDNCRFASATIGIIGSVYH